MRPCGCETPSEIAAYTDLDVGTVMEHLMDGLLGGQVERCPIHEDGFRIAASAVGSGVYT